MTSGIGGAGYGGNHWITHEAGSFMIEKSSVKARAQLFSTTDELAGPYFSLRTILNPSYFKSVVDGAIGEVAEALLLHPHLFPFLAAKLDGEVKLSKKELISYFFENFFLNLQACEVIWADAAREKWTSIGRGITDLRFLIKGLGPALCIKPSNRIDPHIQLKLATDPFLGRLIRNAANYAFDQSRPIDTEDNDFSESLKRIEDITLRYQTVLLPALSEKFTEFEIEVNTYGSNALILILEPESSDEGYRRVSAQFVSGGTKVNLSIRDEEGNATFFAVSPKKEDDTFTSFPFHGSGVGATDEFTLDELLKKGYLIIEIPVKFSSIGLAKINEEKRIIFEKGLGFLENRLLERRRAADKLKGCTDPRRIKRTEDRRGVKGGCGPRFSSEGSTPLTDKLFHAMKTTVGVGSIKGLYDAKLLHGDYNWDHTKNPTITIFDVNAATEVRHVDEKFVSQIILHSLGLYAREANKPVGATTSFYQELPPVRSAGAFLRVGDLEGAEGERVVIQIYPKEVTINKEGKVSFTSLALASREIEIIPGETVACLKVRIKKHLAFSESETDVSLYRSGVLLNNLEIITLEMGKELKSTLDVFISESNSNTFLAPIPLCTFDNSGMKHIHHSDVGDLVNTELLLNGEGDLLRKIKWFERMNLSLFYPSMQISFFCEARLLPSEASFREAYISGKTIDACLSEVNASDSFIPFDLKEIAATPEDLVVTLDKTGIKNISKSFSQVAIDLETLELYLSVDNDEKEELYIRRFKGTYPKMDIKIFGPDEAVESKWLFFENDKMPILPTSYETIPYEKHLFNLKPSPKSEKALFLMTFDNKGVTTVDYSSHGIYNLFELTLDSYRPSDPFAYIEEALGTNSPLWRPHFFCNGKELEDHTIALQKFSSGLEIDFVLEEGFFDYREYQPRFLKDKSLFPPLPVSAPVAAPVSVPVTAPVSVAAKSSRPSLPTLLVDFVRYSDRSFAVLDDTTKIRWSRKNCMPLKFLKEIYDEKGAHFPEEGFFIFHQGLLIKDCQVDESDLVIEFSDAIEKKEHIEFLCCKITDIEIAKVWIAGRYSAQLSASGKAKVQAGAGTAGL